MLKMDGRKKVLIGLLLLLAMLFFIQLWIASSAGFMNKDLYGMFTSALGRLTTGLVLLLGLVIPVYDFSARLKKVNRILFLGTLGLVYVMAFVLVLFLVPYIYVRDQPNYFNYLPEFFINNFHNILKNYIFQIAILFVFEYLRKQESLTSAVKDLEIQLNKTKLNILKSQLQPHFLFNSLNSIVSVIDENKVKAQEMIVMLSELLRSTLNADFQKLTTLGEELDFIEKYLKIEKMRFEDQLEYHIEVSQNARNIKLPTLILQPIIENTIVHGFRGLKSKLNVSIKFDESNKTILVMNNGKRLSGIRNKEHTGLKNVQERLRIFYGGTDHFKLYQNGEHVVNEIILK